MRVPLRNANFLKDELGRKAIADKKVKALTILSEQQHRQLTEDAAQIAAHKKQLGTYQNLLTTSEKQRYTEKVVAQDKVKRLKKRSTKKTIAGTLAGIFIGIILHASL